jgi:hypothetical protein
LLAQQPSRLNAYVRVLVALLLMGGLFTALPMVAAADTASPAPIEGTWNFGGGEILVQPVSGDAFTGTVVAQTTFGSCPHPVGQAIWQIQGSGANYTGTHVWNHADCAPNPGGQSTWTITSTDPSTYTLTFCTAAPGDGPPDPAATPTNFAGGTQCFALTRQLSPGETPIAPTNTSSPVITGTAKAGKTLTCSPGAWTGNPLAYNFSWSVDGTPIAGATHSTYVVPTADEGEKLTCTVVAFNAGGAGSAVSSRPVAVPVPHVAHCPGATGTLSGVKLGLIKLGVTRTQARKAFVRSSDRGKKYEDFFCLTPIGVRVGYASPRLVKTLSASARRKLAGRVVWASTSSLHYAVHGIRVGATTAAAHKALKWKGPFRVGLNDWYLAANGSSTAVFKVRRGLIEEIGIGNKSIMRGRTAQRTFLTSFY